MPEAETEDQIVTPEMRAFIGRSTAPVTYRIRARDIVEFNSAITGELPPITGDPSDSNNTGDLEALGTIVRSFLSAPFDPEFPEPFLDILDAGSSYRFFSPIRAGDEVTVVRTMKDIFTKSGKMGTMLFKVTELTYTRTDGDPVATQISTTITYGRRSTIR